ncbi:MAG: autotransporter domain-containing protein [Hyphomicrobiales bacterium]|nr:autotransporter domain-containing protein [Hyphomicrobiales bacterium]
MDANTLFIGTPGGGIWKTTNGGTTWTPLTDKQATLSISSLAYDPTDPNRNTLIAGTGLTANGSVFGLAASGGLRNGLLYSQDGGNTWTSLGAATLAGQSVAGVAARGSVLVAGTYEISGFASATDRNIGALYRSTDGGANFTKISGTVGTGLPDGPVSSIAGDPSDPKRLYAAVTAPNASSNDTTALFVSNDAGAHWSQVFNKNQSGGTIQGATQTILKVATGPGGAVAVAVVDYLATGGSKVTGLFWSGDSGANWKSLAVPALTSPDLNQGSVNSAIAIDPNNKNLVYVSGDGNANATVSAFRIDAAAGPAGTSNSITEAQTANGSTVHSDSRAITFDANGRLILTSDGTIYARTNPQNNSGVWTSLSGNVSAFETYVVGYDAVGKRLIAAAQDNGVTIQSARNAPLWNAVNGADGVNAFVNDVTLSASGRTVFYHSIYNLGQPARIIVDASGNILSPNTADFAIGTKVTCTLGASHGECTDIVAGANNPGEAVSIPWVNNRVDPTRMAFGGTHVYVTQDTLTGTQDPGATTVDLTLRDLGPTSDGNIAFKIAYGTRDNPNMLVAGSFALSQSTTAAGPLVAVPAYAGSSPTDIVLDPRSQFRYFVADNTRLFGTTNQGATFTNLTDNLRPLSIIRPTALEFISSNGVDALVVGGLNNIANAQSTIAVADSDNNGMLMNWRPFGTGLPNSQVSALAYNAAVDVLAVGTFGRGVFTLYDVTSYFPQALVLKFGLADNDSQPDASFLTDGTTLSGMGFSRALDKYGTGRLTIAGNATYTGGTTILGGTLQLGTGGASGSILGDVAFCSDATNSLCDPSTNKFLAFNRSDVYTFAGAISGPGQVQQIGPGTTILTAYNTYTGGTTVSAGTLQVTNNNSVGTGVVTLDGGIFQAGADGLNISNPFNVNTTGGAVDTNGNTLTLAGVIADGNGPGALAKIGSGRLVLTAASSYTGPTFVNGGTLSVNGSIASSPVFVNAGGTLGGNGVVGPTMILAGGTLSPGNSVGTLTVNGNLVFAAASLYMVEVQGNTADRTNASGTATLAGTVGVVNLGGIPARSYTILSAAAGRIGAFDSVTAVNLPAFLIASLAYTPTDVQLTLTSAIAQIPGLTLNQSSVAAALDYSFNAGGGTLPGLLGLSAAQLPAAMDALSGEGVSATQETAFGAAGMFTSIMLDQGAFWRNGETIDVNGVTFAGEPLAYAPAEKSKTAEHPAFKEMAWPAPYQPRWRAWLTGFDGVFKLAGEAGIGSASISHDTGGLAGGLDYQFASDLLLGFAVGGSSSNFSVRDRITSGHLEGAHFGGYGVKTWGAFYAAGALSFGTFRNSETRSIAGVGPTETATGSFGSNLLSGRVEVGAKQVFGWFAVTPFAAAQFAELWQNAFTETNPVPAGAAGPLGLSYGSISVSSLPTFVGAQFDTRFAFSNGMALSPYARLSWVHEFFPTRSINPTFIALPGAAFTVDGPRVTNDAARIDAGAKLAIGPNSWLFASFDGEFSGRGQSYAGKGGVRIAW